MDEQAKTRDAVDSKMALLETIHDFIREFAELNLELTKQARQAGIVNVNPELLRELRESAQVLVRLA